MKIVLRSPPYGMGPMANHATLTLEKMSNSSVYLSLAVDECEADPKGGERHTVHVVNIPFNLDELDRAVRCLS